MPKREGNIDYFMGTPLELADGTPAKFFGVIAGNRPPRHKYQVIIDRLNAGGSIENFDKDGVPRRPSLPKLRNASRQARYEVIDDEDGPGNQTFFHKAEALAYANSAHLESPGQVKEVIVGEFGKVLSSQNIA